MLDLTCISLLGFLAFLNVVTLMVVRHDKRLAQKQGGAGRRANKARNKPRVPEKTLQLLALGGGGVGLLVGFSVFRHKTRKGRFLLVSWLASIGGALAWAGWLTVFGCW